MRRLLFVLSVMVLGLSLTCCDDNERLNPEFDPDWLAPELPTDDQMSVLATGTICQFGTSNDALTMAIMNRHSGIGDLFTAPDAVNSVMIGSKAISGLSDDDVRLIVSYFMAGKSILVVNPTTATWNELVGKRKLWII